VRPAKGGDPIVLPLNDDMVYAWEVFIAANACGDPSIRSSFAKTLRRHGWPKGVRPYRMRHTFAIDLLLKGVPLETLQGLLGHLNIQTTRIYAPVCSRLSQDAIGRAAAQSADALAVPRAVPRGARRQRKSLRQMETRRDRKKAAGGDRKNGLELLVAGAGFEPATFGL
jgi:hypothetical protein